MSAIEPIVTDVPDTRKLPEGFEPIDLKTYVWEPGRVVRDQTGLIIAYDKEGRIFTGFSCNWTSFDDAATLTIGKPVTFDELKKLVSDWTRSFITDNSLFAKESNAPKSEIIKSLQKSLFVYWFKRLSEIKLIEPKSFDQAKEEFLKHNGNGQS